MAAELHFGTGMRLRRIMLLLAVAAMPLCAGAQSRTARVACTVPAAAELTASGQGAAGNIVVAAPGATTTLTFSYRASKLAGRVAITVRALPAGAPDAGPIELHVAGSGAPIVVAPGGGAVVVWSAGAGAHGWRRMLEVQYATAAEPVRLVYSIAAS